MNIYSFTIRRLAKNTVMHYKVFFTFLFGLIACPAMVNAQSTIYDTITHDAIERDFILYVPSTYNAAVATPLVFNFHGYTSNAFEQMFYGDFRSIADTAGFIIVHPQGTLDATGTTHFNVGWGASTVDDVGFTSALIDSIAEDYNIDQERVYSTGMSNGGFMSFLLACELSDRIAAIASVTGSTTPATLSSCNPQHPTPFMQIHGDNDGTVPYNGSIGWTEPIQDIVNFWVNYNNCSTSAIVNTVPDINTTDGSTVEHYLYVNGDNCVEVEHYKVLNGDHTWPGTAFSFPGTNYDINASEKIWEFFSKYDINGEIGCPVGIEEEKHPENSFVVFPNPTSDLAFIRFNTSGPKAISIYDIIGNLVYSHTTTDEAFSFSVVDWANGIYNIHIIDEHRKASIQRLLIGG